MPSPFQKILKMNILHFCYIKEHKVHTKDNTVIPAKAGIPLKQSVEQEIAGRCPQ